MKQSVATKPTLTSGERALLEHACDAILAVEPRARIILYGSRARGDADPESDWDLLVLTDRTPDAERSDSIRDRLLDLGLESGAALSALVYGKDEWDSARSRVYPLRANVEDDGIVLTAGQDDETKAGPRIPTEVEMAEAREDMVREWLERGRTSLIAAERLAEHDLWNECVSRLYYACFDAARALLLHRGYRFSKHSNVQSLLNRHFGKTAVIPHDLIDLYNGLFKGRHDADYTAFVRFDEEQVRPLIGDARRFLETIERLVDSPGDEATSG